MLVRQKLKPERSRHSEAAVICRAASQADQDFLRVTPNRILDHLADAEGIRAQQITFFRRDPPHSCRRAHFHHRGRSIAEPDVTRLDFPPERIVRCTLHLFTATSLANHVRRALTPVGYWHDIDLCVRQNFAQPRRDILGRVTRIERPFEFVRRDQNPHHSFFAAYSSAFLMSNCFTFSTRLGSFAASRTRRFCRRSRMRPCRIRSAISGSFRNATIFGCSLNSTAPGKERKRRALSGFAQTVPASFSV